MGKWRRRFIERGIEGLFDAPRTGAPRSIDEERVAAAIRETLDAKPKNGSHWSARSTAKDLGIPHMSVVRWNRTGFLRQPAT